MRSELKKILTELTAAIEHDEISFAESENALNRLENELEQAERAEQPSDPAALKLAQARLRAERASWIQQIGAAEAIGSAELGKRIQEIRAALADLEPTERLQRIQTNLKPGVEETRNLQDTLEANRLRQVQLQQRLDELGQEQETLQSQIEQLERAQGEWQQEVDRRKLRQDCLTMAQTIQTIEAKLRQQMR